MPDAATYFEGLADFNGAVRIRRQHLQNWQQYSPAGNAAMMLDTSPKISHTLLKKRMEYMALRYKRAITQPAPVTKEDH